MFESLALLPTAIKQLPIHHARWFVAAAVRLAEAYLLDPSEENLFNFLALPKVGLMPGLRNGADLQERLVPESTLSVLVSS